MERYQIEVKEVVTSTSIIDIEVDDNWTEEKLKSVLEDLDKSHYEDFNDYANDLGLYKGVVSYSKFYYCPDNPEVKHSTIRKIEEE